MGCHLNHFSPLKSLVGSNPAHPIVTPVVPILPGINLLSTIITPTCKLNSGKNFSSSTLQQICNGSIG